MPSKALLPHLEMHVAHACTMRCRFCSHYCDIGYNAPIDDDALLWSIANWSQRIDSKKIRILGGEPTLNKRLVDYIIVCAKYFPGAVRDVVTNGALLHTFSDKLPKILADTGTKLTFTVHQTGTESARKHQQDSIALAKEWQKKYGIALDLPDPTLSGWVSLYQGSGLNIRPFTENNPEASYRICRAKYCHTLLNGMLYKCPPLAYLQFIIAKLKYKKAWEPYLQYKPLSFEDSDEDLKCFIKGNSDYCDMCPTRRMQVPHTAVV